jgi:cytochrome c biogenesis protein CcdA/thiol-disulfide isomerase/thioredoxin
VGLLVGVAFVAGAVTAVSPCVLPVLPIVFAGAATGGSRRPYAVIAGLVVSFTVFTLAAATLLRALGLPEDFLRNLAIAVVFLVGVGLLWEPLGRVLQRPFLALGRRAPGDVGGGFLLGLNLGVLFTPCAGPIIAAIATVAAAESWTVGAVLITLAYALGAGVVLLGFALAARRGLALRSARRRAPLIRRVLGGAMALTAVLMVLGLDLDLATRVPEYTRALQGLEESAAARSEIDDLVGREGSPIEESALRDFGVAPEFEDIALWVNSEPLTLQALRGKVVVLDFWTYSCVNCLRTLPHVKEWYSTYRDDGLVIVGVHTPEFSFERVAENVRREVDSLGIEYPVALDNQYGTWNAWQNRYWPAKYFIDRRGHVRFAHFGEGDYGESEEVIRTLLAESDLPPPVSAALPDRTPNEPQTPETYLGYERIGFFVGSPLVKDREAPYVIPQFIPADAFAYGGRWTVEGERIVAGEDARLRLNYHAHDVFLVLGTSGDGETVRVSVDSRLVRVIRVAEDRLYTLARFPGPAESHTIDLEFTPGTEAYAFTFG